MTPLELLEAARAKIADPEHFTTHVVARDIDGNPCHSKSRSAYCWCTLGALNVSGWQPDVHHLATKALRDAAYPLDIAEANDMGHEHAMAMFDKAIANLKADSNE